VLASPIDGILLSHAGLEHLGALPVVLAQVRGTAPGAGLAVGGVPPHPRARHVLVPRASQWGVSAPVLMTLPVHKMGQMALYDAFLSLDAGGGCDAFSLVRGARGPASDPPPPPPPPPAISAG
jgi:Cft2 family RNA processing exonuclease